MADAEESPSSLAELEALSGLGGVAGRDADEHATEQDAGDFDLAGLAASQAVGDRADDVEPEATVAAVAAVAVTAAAVPAGVSATPAVAPSRGLRGFALGVVAGVVVAGVLFASLNYQPTAPEPPRNASASTVSATAATPITAPTAAVSPNVIAAPQPGNPALAASDLPGKVAAKSSPAGSSARAGSDRAPVAAADSEPRAVDERREDPTRPPDVAVPAEPTGPSRPLDSLLDEAFAPGVRANVKRASDADLMGAELPLTPTASDVTKVIQVLLPAIRGCAMGQSGVANTLLVVRADGVVATASISGAPYAGAASGRCMEGVLRRAKFPRFQQSVFRVQFPLSIRAGNP